MLTKREFLNIYDEAVVTMKEIKLYNDKLNKKLGVSNTSYLLRESEAESEVVENMYLRVEGLIGKMEKSYLDPETARKIGNVKQQLRNQKDRRNQLLEQLGEIAKTLQIEKKSVQKPKKIQTQSFELGQSKFLNESSINETVDSKQNMTQGGYFSKRSLISHADTDDNNTHLDSQVMMEISDFDYDMERKLMHEKKQKIGEAHEQMVRIKGIMDESQDMVNNQGQVLDMIGDDLFVSYKNTVAATNQLVQASSRHSRFRSKMCILIIIFLLIISAGAYAYLYLL